MEEFVRIPYPKTVGDFVHIYKPAPDMYNGPENSLFEVGKRYGEWIPNDFSIIQDGDTFHMVGITHPRPRDFIDDCHFDPKTIHDVEFQLFHATASGRTFAEVFKDGAFADKEKILYPKDRPGEQNEIWAPHLMKHSGKFRVIYSPAYMRAADSYDFKTWETGNALFWGGHASARDPFVFTENGRHYLYYVYLNKLYCRISEDNMKSWGEQITVLEDPYGKESDSSVESPCVFKRGEYYYLLYSPVDGRMGSFDSRTLVFASKDPTSFGGVMPLTCLPAHAPEIFTDPNGDTYLLSVFYPNNGVSAIKLEWVEWKGI